ncbi:MAG: FMN-dependent NADH-azoreductase [Bacillota bacterium]|nr:FMN-dependent NADH-azoreductase [Bacillota bacterium]
MSKVLYITANPKPEELSLSLTVGREFINEYKKKNPSDEIIEIHLYKINIPFIDEYVLNGWNKLESDDGFGELTNEEKDAISNFNHLTTQFINADKYVVATPMWNLSVPPMMKAYIDTVCIAGKTFKYTEHGPEGLLKDKKALHIQASGGVYSEGPGQNLDFSHKYIKSLFNFLGVTYIEAIFIERADQNPSERENIKNSAILQAKKVADKF